MSEVDENTYEGGGFLLEAADLSSCFVPEHFGELEQNMARASEDFYQKYVLSNLAAMEGGDLSLAPRLLDLAAQHGLLALNVPELYGGLNLSGRAALFIAETLGKNTSFSTTYGVHTGIGMLPILYYGNEAQKQKYLPRMVRAELKGCYCLTEPGAGSDPAAGQTRATTKGDHYLLNGQKIWISNAGFADVFIVFAKIDEDDQLSAFIVEKGCGGLELQAEEKKMGIKASSTRQVFFVDCPVPSENLLGKRGQGFKIALNILNIGRLKLAVGCMGCAKDALSYAIAHARERKQFSQALSEFGAIRQKIAEMSQSIFVCESAIYRTAATIDQAIEKRRTGGQSIEQARMETMESFAVECALLKVHASETVGHVVDEAVQIFGGMGYSEEAPMATFYRDVRITRIYEGTNEINRMFSVGMLLRRAKKGLLPLEARVKAISEALLRPPLPRQDCEGPLQKERQSCEQLKELFLLITGRAADVLQSQIKEAQEILIYAADIAMDVYTTESALLRAARLSEEKHPHHHLSTLVAQNYLQEASQRIQFASEHIIGSLPLGAEEKNILHLAANRFTKRAPQDTIANKRQVAQAAIQKGRYPFTFY